MTERVLLRVSPQGQVTLRRAVLEALGHPRLLECWVEDGALRLRPVLAATLDEAEARFAAYGLTRDVFREAVRILMAREKAGAGAAQTAHGRDLDDIPINEGVASGQPDSGRVA